jgi:hypothetical protein
MAEKETIFEKHLDATYNTFYYFNVATNESTWELPLNATIIDKTISNEPEAKDA